MLLLIIVAVAVPLSLIGWIGLRHMSIAPAGEPGQRSRGWLLALRYALFALGLSVVLDPILSGAFREWLSSPAVTDWNLLGMMVDIIISGVGAGLLLLILGAAIGPVARHPNGWVALGLTMLGLAAPFAGFGLIFGPGGGDQMTPLGGLGFLLILFGTPLFFGAYVWAVVLAIKVLAQERRDRRDQRRLVTHSHI